MTRQEKIDDLLFERNFSIENFIESSVLCLACEIQNCENCLEKETLQEEVENIIAAEAGLKEIGCNFKPYFEEENLQAGEFVEKYINEFPKMLERLSKNSVII